MVFNFELLIPGAPETDSKANPFLKSWGNYIFNLPCHDKRVMQMCIFGIEDLPIISNETRKFCKQMPTSFSTIYTLQCIDKLVDNETRVEYFNGCKPDINKYQSLGPVTKTTQT